MFECLLGIAVGWFIGLLIGVIATYCVILYGP
jgi:hypothetical protein